MALRPSANSASSSWDRKMNGAFEVAAADPPGLGNQELQGPPHEPNPQPYGQHPADQEHAADEQRGPPDQRPVRRPAIRSRDRRIPALPFAPVNFTGQ